MLDREAVLTASETGRALRSREAELRRALQAEFDEIKLELEASERELTRLRDELPKVEFDSRVEEFDTRVRAARRDSRERTQALEAAISDGRKAFDAALRPVLENVMRERSATVMLKADDVVIAANLVDVTQAVIDALDAVGVEIDITPSYAAPERSTAAGD